VLAVLDPCLVSPHIGQALDADEVVATIRELRSEVGTGALTLLVSDGLHVTLAEQGLYPLRESLEAFLSAGDDEQSNSGVDVARLVLELLQRGRPIESIIVDFEVAQRRDNFEIVIEPLCACHPGMVEATRYALEAACALSIASPQMTADFIASVRGAGNQFKSKTTFALILCVDERSLESITQSLAIPLCTTAEVALSVADPTRILMRAHAQPSEAWFAISAAAQQHSAPSYRADWDLHPVFVSDLMSPQIQNNSTILRKVLRACAEVVCDSDPAASHALRTGSGASAAQVKFDGQKAWRQDVDREWHLHFWRSEGGHIQFASLRGHNYMDIPNPAPAGAALTGKR
jgi:hypothetical protein